MNPLFSAINTPNLGNISDLVKSIKGNNPMAMLNNMAKSNPQIRQILDMLNRGANPQQLFYQMCQQRGINPQDILSQLK